MGLMDWLKKEANNFETTRYHYDLGCEILGDPHGGYLGSTLAERMARVNAGRKEARRRELNAEFGTGEVACDDHWTPPVHATTRDGKPVTVSFGRGPRAGQTLICDGHVDLATFYEKRAGGKGHDHYLVDGKAANDRGRYSDS